MKYIQQLSVIFENPTQAEIDDWTVTYENETGDLNRSQLTGYRNKWEAEVSASLKVSYAVVTLNFYL